MKRVLVAAAAALAFAAPAAAFEFDNSTCKEFLVGTWEGSGSRTVDGKTGTITSHSVYNEDGTFTSTRSLTIEGQAAQAQELKGTWEAKAGPDADTCEASITPEGGEKVSVVLKVLDANTVQGPTGDKSVRAAA